MGSCVVVAARREIAVRARGATDRVHHPSVVIGSLIASRRYRTKSIVPMVRHVALEKVVVARAAKSLVLHRDRVVLKAAALKVDAVQIPIACLIDSMRMKMTN